jgi:hypothetical protein
MNETYPRRPFDTPWHADPALNRDLAVRLVCPRTEPSDCLTCGRPAPHRIEVLGYARAGLRCPDHGMLLERKEP